MGKKIDHLIPYLNLPKQDKLAIRGELIIKENIFQGKYKEQYKNSRNFVSGIVNKKQLTQEDKQRLKDIDFVAYELIEPTNLTPSQQLNKLQEMNATTVENIQNITNDKLTNKFLSEKLLEWRSSYHYTIDGIICIQDKVYPRISKNPEHAFAFKMVISDQVVEAKVVDVLWTASKDGLLKPRIQIEPVTIGGAKIEYATAFNAKFVEDNKIGVGAVVRLIRSGDVIPHIEAIVTPASTILMPKQEYEWNETHVDIVLKNKEDDETVKIKTITKFFKTLEVDKLGEANIKKNSKYKSRYYC